MRIAFVSQPWAGALPPSESTAIWNREVARRLFADGHEVTIYAVAHMRPPGEEVEDGVRYRFIGLRADWRMQKLLERIPSRSRRPHFAWRASFFEYGLRVALDARRRDFDFVHIHNFSQFLPLLARLRAGRRLAIHMHCEWLSALDPRMIASRLRHADLIIGCSDYVSNETARAHPELAHRCVTIPNGVDPERFRPAARGGDPRPLKLLFVGRISPEKGIVTLLDAFRRARADCPDIELELVGPEASTPREMLVDLYDSPAARGLACYYDQGPSYFEQARRGLDAPAASRVSMRGKVSYGELPGLYAGAGALISASIAEAFGMPLVEAMSCELPVIATRAGGQPEIVVDGENGLIVEPGDAPALAGAIARLASDRDLRRTLGRAGRRTVLERFSWQRITEALLARYDLAAT